MRKLLALFCVFALVVGERVSVTEFSNGFVDGVRRFEGPTKISANVPLTRFALDLTMATRTLLNNLVLDYYRQVKLTSIILDQDWRSSTRILLKKLNESSMGKENSMRNSNLDKYLDHVSNHANQFLLMSPGIPKFENQTNLSYLPNFTGSVVTHFENYEPKDLFNDLEALIDRDMESIRNFVQVIYSAGWKRARPLLAKLQLQFRDQFLHCKFLKFWLEEAKKVDNWSEKLRENVSPNCWRNYERASERIKMIGATLNLDRKFCGTDASSGAPLMQIQKADFSKQ